MERRIINATILTTNGKFLRGMSEGQVGKIIRARNASRKPVLSVGMFQTGDDNNGMLVDVIDIIIDAKDYYPIAENIRLNEI